MPKPNSRDACHKADHAYLDTYRAEYGRRAKVVEELNERARLEWARAENAETQRDRLLAAARGMNLAILGIRGRGFIDKRIIGEQLAVLLDRTANELAAAVAECDRELGA